MRQLFTKRLFTLLAAGTLLSCTEPEEGLDYTPDRNAVTFTTSEILTRATATFFEQGDQILVVASGAVSGEAIYSYKNGTFTSTSPITIEEGQSVSYTARYPHDHADWDPSTFAVQADQSQGLASSMLLKAVTTPSDSQTQELSFYHEMGYVLLTVNFIDADGQAVEQPSIFVTLNAQLEMSGKRSLITPMRSDNRFHAMIAPQSIEAGENFLSIAYMGISLEWAPEDMKIIDGGDFLEIDLDVTLKQGGLVESATITVDGTQEVCVVGETEGYHNDPYGYGDALIYTDLPTPNAGLSTFIPSSISTPYYPITVYYGSKSATDISQINNIRTNTRIIDYMPEFKPDYSPTSYKVRTNKYGSDLNGGNWGGTGRFRTEKIDGRWWIIDPEGYRHIQRGASSVRHTDSSYGSSYYLTIFGSATNWAESTREDFTKLGITGAGGFSSTTQADLISYNNSVGYGDDVEHFTLTPSFSFQSNFRRSEISGLNGKMPDGSTDNTALESLTCLHEKWNEFCTQQVNTNLTPFENDHCIVGFFSDNELLWRSHKWYLLDQLYTSTTPRDNYAWVAAEEFLANCKLGSITFDEYYLLDGDMREKYDAEFLGFAADAYYSGIRYALEHPDNAHIKDIMYLGARTNTKGIPQLFEAAAKSCDVISINYYGSWSVDHTGATDTSSGAFVSDIWENVDAPFMITEFWVKGLDSELPDNSGGTGLTVATQAEKGYWYQHFTMGLLESTHCVGWCWFKYMDGADANCGIYRSDYTLWETFSHYMKGLNYNAYELADYFNSKR